MPTNLVRTVDEHDLVGIFVASNLLKLSILIDEGVDNRVGDENADAEHGSLSTSVI